MVRAEDERLIKGPQPVDGTKRHAAIGYSIAMNVRPNDAEGASVW